jgi:glycosyltransferase involved in cell wall biosynthesis
VGVVQLFSAVKKIYPRTFLVTPEESTTSFLPRYLWNCSLPRDPFLSSFPEDTVFVGVDMDGVFLYRERFILLLKGVKGDERIYERGAPYIGLTLQMVLERKNIEKAQKVFVTSLYSKKRVEELYRIPSERIEVLPEGVDIRSFSPGDGRGSSYPGRILTVCRFYPRKNLLYHLQALLWLKSRGVPFSAILVGEGPTFEEVKKGVSDLHLENQVELCGEVSFSRLKELYRSSHIFALPTLQEGFGIVFLEAMASGLPVVALRRGAVEEVVPHGKGGFLAEQFEEYCEYLALLLTREDLRERMGRYGREYVKKFTWDRIGREFLRKVRSLYGL